MESNHIRTYVLLSSELSPKKFPAFKYPLTWSGPDKTWQAPSSTKYKHVDGWPFFTIEKPSVTFTFETWLNNSSKVAGSRLAKIGIFSIQIPNSLLATRCRSQGGNSGITLPCSTMTSSGYLPGANACSDSRHDAGMQLGTVKF